MLKFLNLSKKKKKKKNIPGGADIMTGISGKYSFVGLSFPFSPSCIPSAFPSQFPCTSFLSHPNSHARYLYRIFNVYQMKKGWTKKAI